MLLSTYSDVGLDHMVISFHLFMYVSAIWLSSLRTCPVKPCVHFESGCRSCCCWVSGVLCIFRILSSAYHQTHVLQMFPFTLRIVSFDAQNLKFFIKPSLSIFPLVPCALERLFCTTVLPSMCLSSCILPKAPGRKQTLPSALCLKFFRHIVHFSHSDGHPCH